MASNLVQVIKEVAMDAFNASKPTQLVIGTVKKTSPLEIKTGNLILDSDFLYITTTAANNISYAGTGAVVLMIRQVGGQRFAVIDTIN